MKWKLGLDMGSTSIGWAALELNDKDEIIGLADLGVRIFPDGRDAKKHTPINVERRNARTMRRRTDRVKARIRNVVSILRNNGMNPSAGMDPYELRVRALDEKLSPDELGRAIEHLAVRRGFKSNRKETRGEGGGKLKAAQARAQDVLQKYRTFGEYMAKENKLRFNDVYDAAGKVQSDALLPIRELYLDEFHKICDAQDVNPNLRKELENAIFFQRPLAPQEVGPCQFEQNEKRAYKYDPAFQKFRALQTLNQLEIIKDGRSEKLTPEQWAKARAILLETFEGVNKKGNITFAELRKQLGIGKNDGRFNLEAESRKEIQADKTAFVMSGIDSDWRLHPDVIDLVNGDKQDEEVSDELRDKYRYSNEQIEEITSAPFEDGTGNLSVFAMNKINEFLEQGLLYNEACDKAGYKFSDQDIQPLDNLPEYGTLPVIAKSCVNGRIQNTTVHIALNQLRLVVNELIGRYGKPAAVNIETARDIRYGAKQIGDKLSEQAKNKKENDRIAEMLESNGKTVNHENITRVKIWERMAKRNEDRMCPYTGRMIGFADLFGGEFEVEHVLPFSRTFDDSMSNKIISATDANRWKKNRTPAEAFTAADCPDEWKYDRVVARAENLPDNIKWRFRENAMEKFNKDGGCLARALNDTRFMNVIATLYLKHICVDKNKVAGLPGQMTALFREMWNLNFWKEKDADVYRASHIHHAIDAFVVACMTRGNLQTIATNATALETAADGDAKTIKEFRKYLFGNTRPYESFVLPDFYNKCWNTNISYRPTMKDVSKLESGHTVGQLHEDTAYGLKKFVNEKSLKAELHVRKEKISETLVMDADGNAEQKKIKTKSREPSTKDISDLIPVFRTKQERDEYHKAFADWYAQDGVAAQMKPAADAGKEMKNIFKQKLAKQKEKESALLKNVQKKALKAYKWFIGGNNYCADVFEIRKDDKRYPKLAGTWQIEIMSNYMATLKNGTPMWRGKHPTAKRIMQLKTNDVVRAQWNKNEEIPAGIRDSVLQKCNLERKDVIEMNFRVKKLDGGTVTLRPDFIAKEGEKVEKKDGTGSYTNTDNKSWRATAESLKEHKARKVFISPIGELK